MGRRVRPVAALLAGVVTGCAPSPDHRAEHHHATLAELRFDPHAVRAAPGDTITWINEDLVPHTVSAAGTAWDSGEIAPGASFTWVVDGTGDVPVSCRYHPLMTALVHVR